MATLKSKASKQKTRRWTFLITVVKEDVRKYYTPPALTIGNSADAQKASAEILKDINTLPQFEGSVITVTPVGHEIVSSEILNQINGLNDQADLLTRALKTAVTDVVKADSSVESKDFDAEVTKRLGQYVMEERNKLQGDALAQAGIDVADVVPDMPIDVPDEYAAAEEERFESAEGAD